MRGLLLVGLLSLSPSVQAGEIILRLPDAVLKTKVQEKCTWVACEAERNGGYKTDEEKARWLLDHVIRPIVDAAIKAESRGRDSFESLGAELDVRFDTEP